MRWVRSPKSHFENRCQAPNFRDRRGSGLSPALRLRNEAAEKRINGGASRFDRASSEVKQAEIAGVRLLVAHQAFGVSAPERDSRRCAPGENQLKGILNTSLNQPVRIAP